MQGRFRASAARGTRDRAIDTPCANGAADFFFFNCTGVKKGKKRWF
jgi:hypothetical protein